MNSMRSWLFVPGHKNRMVEKSLGLNVDSIILDIEDGVPPEEKQNARKLISNALQTPRNSNTPSRFVRINAIGHERMEKDLETILIPGLDGLVLPKVESVEEVENVQHILDAQESNFGIEPETVSLLVAIENPKGLLQSANIASCKRVVGLMFGAEDFGHELGLPMVREKEAQELIYARSNLVISAASANVQAVDGVWPNIDDVDGLWSDTYQARRLGFTGKSLFHPSQIEAINTIFSPSSKEVDYCKQVIEAFDKATGEGEGSIAFGGQLIDLPIVERARRTVYLADQMEFTDRIEDSNQ